MNKKKLKTLGEAFGEKFRACNESETEVFRKKFKTPLQPIYVSLDEKVMVGRNDLPESKSLEADVFSALYTNTNRFAVKYLIGDNIALDYAGAGIITPIWRELNTLEETQEAALCATLKTNGI